MVMGFLWMKSGEDLNREMRRSALVIQNSILYDFGAGYCRNKVDTNFAKKAEMSPNALVGGGL
jgi:hypothetical protein